MTKNDGVIVRIPMRVVDEDGVVAAVVVAEEEDAVVVAVVGTVTRNNDEIGNQTELRISGDNKEDDILL